MGLRVATIGMLVLLVACAERAEPAGEAPGLNEVERNRMYLAQERELLKLCGKSRIGRYRSRWIRYVYVVHGARYG